MLSCFIAALAAQKPVQATIGTCHGMDNPMPYGQAYRTKSSSPRIFDPHFCPASHHYGLSLLAGWQNCCCQAEEVDSAHWAAKGMSGQKKYCHLHGLKANGFHVAAEGALGIVESRFKFGIVAQSGYCHAIPRFGTHDEAT